MSANIVLSLSATKLEVAPGESIEATITIRNQSQVVDQFGIRIQGLDPTWWTLSTSSVSLFPGDQGETKLTIHPPKEAESKAGSYSFQVRAVSQANSKEMSEEEAYLTLRSFQAWDVEMSPTKVVGRSGTYRITASNSGNTDITLILEGKDPEEALDYTFSHSKVTVPAGENALITLKASPKKGERGKLYSFQVTVTPAGAKVPSKEAKTINGQLEYQPRRWPWKWILLGLAIVAIVILLLIFIPPLCSPPLPVIISFRADPTSITEGDSSELSWDVSGATEVIIDQGIGSVGLTGPHTVSPSTTTTYTLTASNEAGSSTDTATVTVEERELPDLTITTGSPTVTPSTVAPGQTVSLSAWTVENQGNADSGSFSNGFYLSTDSVITASDTYLGENSNTNRVPGGEFNWGGPTLTIPSGTSPGNYYIGILVDRNNVVSESNEDNNYVASPITVSTPPLSVINYLIAGGRYHTVGLKSDGTVVAVGGNDYGQCNVGDWADISQVAAGSDQTVGVKDDGTAVAVGNNNNGECDVGGWTGIIQVAVGGEHTVGLKSDGTVVAVGWNQYSQCNVEGWTDIIQVAAGMYYTVGLKSDGTMVAVGHNNYGQLDVGGWTGIVQVSTGYGHTVGLRSDGTAVAVGRNDYGQCNIGGLTGIVQISAGSFHTVGLKSNGTAAAVGWNDDGQCNIGGWTGITRVSGGSWHTVGLKSNGTVVAVGRNNYGQCNVGDWWGVT